MARVLDCNILRQTAHTGLSLLEVSLNAQDFGLEPDSSPQSLRPKPVSFPGETILFPSHSHISDPPSTYQFPGTPHVTCPCPN